MTSLSEFAIFKHCVENPQKLDKSLSQLDLKFIKDPAAPAEQDPTSPAARNLEDLSPKEALEAK